ncbi:MAG TPA: hypothetical protein VN132_05040, partial [Bdellovibrio sp.]|nr:hypothetical protein [Bdellovibrio sp.]
DGGRGGNGGHGTSGANGGRGGRIVVELPEKDTALLMLVEHDVSAGRGGRAGQHGQPGSGGSGGSGGSSYSWTTYEGSGNDRRSVSHSQSGGWSGSSGSSGSSPSDYLSQGRDGAEGSYQIRVLTEEGVKTYDRAYNLNLVDYNLIPESKNGILEPGEKVFVHNLRVRNTGGMPTPRFTKIRIFLRNSEYSIADSMELEIPKSLAPNEVYTFAGNSLSFVIKNNIFRTAQEDRTRWDDHIQPLAQMTEVERSFNQFSAPRSIEITYPVEIEPIITSRSVAPGEKTQVLLRIKNISTADFGSTSELQRELAVFLRKTSGDLATSNFKLVDEQGRDLNMQEGILKAVDHLKAGESALIAGQLEIGPQAEPFSRAEIGFRLDIGTPKGATAKTSIQDRHVNFSISQVYRRDPSANVLLVVNSGIDKERSWALKKMIENVGLKPAIWDLSYYGEISLTKMLDHGSSFAEDFKGMNIVIANNIFEVNQGVTSAAQYISHRELAEAASKKGIGVLILGGDAGSVIDNTNKVSIEKRPNISVSKWRLWGKPSEDQMTEEANDLLNDISKKDPSGNYVVVHSFSPQLLKTAFGGILKTWSLGNLEVHRSLDTRHASIVAVNVGQGGNLTPSDIYSRSTEVAFAMSLSVDKRMKILNEKLKSSNAEDVNIAYVIAQSLIMSVVEEQSALRRLQWYTNFTYRELDVRMPHLNAIL